MSVVSRGIPAVARIDTARGRRHAGPMRFATVLLLILTTAVPARAEINLHDSVEWLCARSVIVARGTLTAVSPEDPSGGEGKSRDLVSLTFAPTQLFRGVQSATTPLAPIHFSMRVPETVRLRAWMRDHTELVVFLRETIQSYRRDGKNYSLWPVRETGSQEQMLVALASPHVHLLSAGELDHATSPARLEAACKRAADVTPEGRTTEPAGPHFLEVPPESPAYGALYSGSTCYLYVPVGVFKRARPTL